MAVCSDISTIEADVSCLGSGNDLDLCRYKVLLSDAVFIRQELQDGSLVDLFFLCLLVSYGNTADDDVKVFCRDELRCLLCHLCIA